MHRNEARNPRPAGRHGDRSSLAMSRIASSPSLCIRPDKERDVRTWLLDNWIYQNRPASKMTQSSSLTGMEEMVAASTHLEITTRGFNINEDDLDCPGHGSIRRPAHLLDTLSVPAPRAGLRINEDVLAESSRHRQMSISSSEGPYEASSSGILATSSSSEGLYDESPDEEEFKVTAKLRGRSMSVDEEEDDSDRDSQDLATPKRCSPTGPSSEDRSNNNFPACTSKAPRGSGQVTFNLIGPDDDDDNDTGNDDDADTDSDDSNLKTPTGRGPPPRHVALSPESGTGTFFRLERRASFDNGVFGMPDRILRGEVMGSSAVGRNAVTAPGTPADPGTPVGRYLSEEERALLLHPELLFDKIHSLLCAERVTQMTKTYNDIEAVTRLLEEKERDLELAARIGQTLLSKNKELAVRGDALDEQLSQANDKIKQLRHDLSMKDDLLKFYCQDLQEQSSGELTPEDGAFNLNRVNVESLQKKVATLEDENVNLRFESAQLRTDTEHYEEKEKRLVEDCLQQLGEVNQQIEVFAEELRVKTEESSRQKEEMTALLAQVADLHKRVRELMIENKDLAEKLQASQESQKLLTKELSAQQDKYDELFEMLEEAQDELRGHRNRNNPKATRHLYASSHVPSPVHKANSLASELESSLLQEGKEQKEENEKRVRNWKIFETARAARKAASKSSHESSVRMSTGTSASSSTKDPNSVVPSGVNSDNESFNSDGYSADMDSLYGSCSELGRPGIPGSNDLESALRRLAMRRANDLNEHDYFQSLSGHDKIDLKSQMFHIGDTPDSVASPASGYSYLGISGSHPTTTHFKIPDKLQIVKPLEGSVTLRHWQRLAQPHLGGIFEQREGVKSKGERKLDLEGEVYTLSDFEEDEDALECPSRRMADSTSTVYTFTNSMVNQPNYFPSSPTPSGVYSASHVSQSGTSTPLSQVSSSGFGSRRPQHSSTRSTYSMSLGLAAILQGREESLGTRSLMHPVASCPVIPAESIATVGPDSRSGTATPTSPKPYSTPTSLIGAVAAVTTADTQTPGLLGKLISTGYSLLWNKTDTHAASTPRVSREGTPEQKPTAEQIMPKGSSTGVLGAIASFRKNGML